MRLEDSGSDDPAPPGMWRFPNRHTSWRWHRQSGQRGQAPDVEAEDGVLSSADIAAVSLCNTEIVVLSACETGLGIIDDAEGVLGIRRAFVIAGAGSLLHIDVWETRDSHCIETEPDNYLLTYTLVQSATRAPRRATILRRSAGAWKIVWRQGTVVEDD